MALGYLPDDALGSDEDDSSDEFDMDVYRTSQDWLLHSESDRERFLATARGRVATGKRVPSKEALASLEKVKPEDLTGNDRSKSELFPWFGGILTAIKIVSSAIMRWVSKIPRAWLKQHFVCHGASMSLGTSASRSGSKITIVVHIVVTSFHRK